MVSPVYTGKLSTTIELWISLGTKFQVKLKILFFWTKFAQKEYSWSKTEKVNIVIEFCIFKLVWVPNFSLDLTIGFFGPNFPKKGVSSLKLKIRIFACIVSMAVSYYIQLFCRWTNRHNGICNKTRKRRVRRLFMMVKPRRCAVRKARKVRKGSKARINDGWGA